MPVKGLITVASGEVVQMLFTSGELPEVGSYYFLEKSEGGTGAQNRAFHSLVMEYFRSGQHSYDADSYDDFRNLIKRHLGEGFEAFIYVEMEQYEYEGYGQNVEYGTRPVIKDAKTKEEIPEHIINDPNMKEMIRGRLKSWADYTKKQRQNTIDNLIAEMLQAGVNTAKFEEIIRGME